MSDGLSDEALHRIARRRFRDKMAFCQHLVIYVLVNGILALVWRFSTDIDHPWFLWATVPWGIGLLFHFAAAFIFPGKKEGDQLKAESERRADRKKGFYRHLGLYLVVNALLIAVWAGTGAESDPVPWFAYPLGGWGIFVVWGWLEAFVFVEETGWQKRQIQNEFDRLKKAGN